MSIDIPAAPNPSGCDLPNDPSCDLLEKLVEDGMPEESPAGLPANLPSGSPVAALADVLSHPPNRREVGLPRWLGPVAVLGLIGFIPWMVYLGMTLPRRARADHYDVAWIGFDGMLWVSVAALTWCIVRRHPAVGPLAGVTGTLLIVDAWFDVITSSSRNEFMAAVALAAVAEIPAAIICAWMAVHAERIQARAYRRLRLRWQWAALIARRALAAQPDDDPAANYAVSRATGPQAWQ